MGLVDTDGKATGGPDPSRNPMTAADYTRAMLSDDDDESYAAWVAVNKAGSPKEDESLSQARLEHVLALHLPKPCQVVVNRRDGENEVEVEISLSGFTVDCALIVVDELLRVVRP